MEKASNMFIFTRGLRLSVGILTGTGMNVRQNGAIGMRFKYLEGWDGNVLELEIYLRRFGCVDRMILRALRVGMVLIQSGSLTNCSP